MTDYTELKRLAENHLSLGQAYTVAKPSAVLALIAENERLTNSLHEAREDRNKLGDRYDAVNAEVAGLKTGYEAYEQTVRELRAEVEALHREREGKVLCDLELFETLRDSANTEADEHRQCMATYRPLRQASLDSIVKKCDDLLAAVGQKAPAAEIIWCACGDGHAANSYGAGFMDANKGVCVNCDAAMGKGEQS